MPTDINHADLIRRQGQVDRLELSVRRLVEAEEQRKRRNERRLHAFAYTLMVAIVAVSWTPVFFEAVRGG